MSPWHEALRLGSERYWFQNHILNFSVGPHANPVQQLTEARVLELPSEPSALTSLKQCDGVVLRRQWWFAAHKNWTRSGVLARRSAGGWSSAQIPNSVDFIKRRNSAFWRHGCSGGVRAVGRGLLLQPFLPSGSESPSGEGEDQLCLRFGRNWRRHRRTLVRLDTSIVLKKASSKAKTSSNGTRPKDSVVRRRLVGAKKEGIVGTKVMEIRIDCSLQEWVYSKSFGSFQWCSD